MQEPLHPVAKRNSRRIRMHFPLAAVLMVAGVNACADVTAVIPTGRRAIPSAPLPSAMMVNVEPLDVIRSVSVLAKGLRSPDGIARDAESGDVFVAMEEGPAIVRIGPDGSRNVLIDRSTPLYEGDGAGRKRVLGLRSPEGLALDGKGTLYVVEDIPGGRLISFDLKGPAAHSKIRGQVVSVPFGKNPFAWESIDIGPAGELLMAGSTMETFVGGGGGEGLFRGAILYRDAGGEWWLPMNDTMPSYSAACFSPDGTYAYFACEVSGDVGCLDLRSHKLRTFHVQKTFHAPEGLHALPDGSVLMAEEAGKIYRLDPMASAIQLLYDNQGPIESVHWDGRLHRLLVTDDLQGTLISLELKAGWEALASTGTVQDILFEAQTITVKMIPEQCPDYLARVLKLGGYDPFQKDGEIVFRDFAEKYCLVAVDADATLLTPAEPGGDPIQHIQFVIVAPYLIGIDMGELIWSSSGFALIKKSGQIEKTRMVRRDVIHGDLMESRFTPIGGQKVALPIPVATRIDSDGIATVHFMGMGVTPDYLLMLNTAKPDLSFLLVMEPDKRPQQYRIYPPPSRQEGGQWVVALERKEPKVWQKLSPDK